MSDELLPCPFCGAKPNLNPEFMREWQVECVCGVQAPPKMGRIEAIAAWNRRAEAIAALAPTDAAHVNETPKSEHDADNVLTDAAQAPAEDAHVKGETDGQMLERLGMVGWFCNAIMAGYDRAPTDAAQAEDGYPYDGPEQCERDLEDTAAQARECCDLCGSDVTDMDGHLVHDEGCNGDTYAPAAQAREAALRGNTCGQCGMRVPCGGSECQHPAALAPTDAAHVNETPKSEHDAGNVLTDAALIARLREIQGQAGLFASAAADRIDALMFARAEATQEREAALKKAAQLAYEVWDDPEALAKAILALIGEDKPTLGKCECGMTGPCMWDQCKHPLIGEARE